ncbi:ABC transporter ATP-binding protein [Sanguibacter sp. HDW7]|uniref:ABC transporter ATP-binding protein n=1 Tax=Sanguibacter sp. HDW7 TaxID=2714931 RepID=UPI00140B9D06|nr:ABC transporter ATP-binding protein [Sanguibacter sp. HDW7]QIK84226.1 ABC transporter ATP-binding protein [Sanguibacter sp. HDW7]
MSARATGISARDVTRAFDGRAVLDGFSLDVAPGEFVALLGPSGSGKTTFLRILAGLETHDDGDVEVGEPLSVVFQEPRLLPGTRLLGNVLLGRRRGRESRAQALAALSEVGLEGRERAWPTQLSGGEAQRVALARALVRDPGVLLLDEPFAALDALTRIRMQMLVADLCRRHRPAALLVTHDVDEAILLADRVVVLTDGRVGLDVTVPFARPRRRGVPGFGDLRLQLLDALGVVERVGAS